MTHPNKGADRAPVKTAPVPDCVAVIEAAVEQYRQGDTVEPDASQPLKKVGPKRLTDEEREAKIAAKESVVNRKRFQLITRSTGTFGIWDGLNATVMSVFYTESEAIEELARLRSGKSYSVNYNWTCHQQTELQEV